jgi:hypothetical protein
VAREIAEIISGRHTDGGDRVAFSARFSDGTTEKFVCSTDAMPLMLAVLQILRDDAAVERRAQRKIRTGQFLSLSH